MSKKQSYKLLIPHTLREASYGAGIADNYHAWWMEMEKPLMLGREIERLRDTEFIKGYEGTGNFETVLKYAGKQASMEMLLNADIMPLVLGSMWGTVPTVAGDNYTHTAKQPALTVTSPLTISLIEWMEYAAMKKYTGVAFSDLEISCNRGEMAMLKTGLLHQGLVSTPNPSSPASTVKATTFFSHAALSTLTFGPVGAQVDISDICDSVVIRQSADLKPVHTFGSAYPSRIDRGNPTWGVELVVEGTYGDTIWQYHSGTTALEFTCKWQISTESVQFFAGKCYIADEPEIEYKDGYISTLKFPLDLHYDTGDASAWVWTIRNAYQTYLAAA